MNENYFYASVVLHRVDRCEEKSKSWIFLEFSFSNRSSAHFEDSMMCFEERETHTAEGQQNKQNDNDAERERDFIDDDCT